MQVRHCQTCRGLMARRAIAPLDYCIGRPYGGTETLKRGREHWEPQHRCEYIVPSPYGSREAIEIRNVLHGRTMILQILQRLIPINDASPHTICQDYADADREKGRRKERSSRKGQSERRGNGVFATIQI